MGDVGIDQMEDEGWIEEDSRQEVGGAEVWHFRDCWEFATVVSWSFKKKRTIRTETFERSYVPSCKEP